jgi:hypothetical protein
VPLVMLAYLATAAGLLMGSGGEIVMWVVAGGLGAALACWRRSVEAGALACLTMVGGLTGWSVAAADARCAISIERNGYATVRLREAATPRATARGIASGDGCRVATRIRVATGDAAAGSMVHVRGTARREGARVAFSDAGVRVIDSPGLLARWRTNAGTTIDALYGERAPLARALLIADEQDISREVRSQFADASVTPAN